MNNKTKLIIIVVCILAVAAAVVVALVLHNKGDSRTDTGTEDAVSSGSLDRFSVEYSGDDAGSYYKIEIKVTGETDIVASYASREANGMPTVSDRKVCSREVVDEIESIIEEYKITEWGELDDSGEIALDAGTTEYSFSYDGREYTYNSNQEFPENGSLALRMIYSLLKAQFQ